MWKGGDETEGEGRGVWMKEMGKESDKDYDDDGDDDED